MTKQVIGIGTVANDGTGDALRTAFNKANLNFTELYTGSSGLLAKSGAAVALTGSTSETTMATITIPANTVGANGIVRVSSFWTMTGSTNSKTIRHRLGGAAGTVLYSIPVNGAAATAMRVESTTIAANATNSQNTLSFAPRGSDFLITTAAPNTSVLDMTASQDLVISGQLASAGETLTLVGYIVEYIA